MLFIILSVIGTMMIVTFLLLCASGFEEWRLSIEAGIQSGLIVGAVLVFLLIIDLVNF